MISVLFLIAGIYSKAILKNVTLLCVGVGKFTHPVDFFLNNLTKAKYLKFSDFKVVAFRRIVTKFQEKVVTCWQ